MAAILSPSPRRPKTIEGFEDESPLLANEAPTATLIKTEDQSPRRVQLEPKDILKLADKYYIYPHDYTPKKSTTTTTKTTKKVAPIIMKDGYNRDYLYNEQCRIPTTKPNWNLTHVRMNCVIFVYLWIIFGVINLSTIHPRDIAHNCSQWNFEYDCTDAGSTFCGDMALCQPILHNKDGFTPCGCYPNQELFSSIGDSEAYLVDQAVQQTNPLFIDVIHNFPEEYPEVKYVTISIIYLFYIFLGITTFRFFIFTPMIAMCHLCGKGKPTRNAETYQIEPEDWMNYLCDNPAQLIVSIFYRYTFQVVSVATRFNLAFPTVQFLFFNVFLLYIPLLLILSLLASAAYYLFDILLFLACCGGIILLIIGFIMNQCRWRNKNKILRKNLFISSIQKPHYRWIASSKRKEAGSWAFMIGTWCLFATYIGIWFMFIAEFKEIFRLWVHGQRPCKERDAENHLHCTEFAIDVDDYGLLIFAVIIFMNLIRYILEWVYVIKCVDGKIIYDIYPKTGNLIIKDYASFLYDPLMWKFINFIYPDVGQVMGKLVRKGFDKCNKYLIHMAVWVISSAVLTVVPFHWVVFIEERMRFETLLPLGIIWVSFMIVRISRVIVKLLV